MLPKPSFIIYVQFCLNIHCILLYAFLYGLTCLFPEKFITSKTYKITSINGGSILLYKMYGNLWLDSGKFVFISQKLIVAQKLQELNIGCMICHLLTEGIKYSYTKKVLLA